MQIIIMYFQLIALINELSPLSKFVALIKNLFHLV